MKDTNYIEKLTKIIIVIRDIEFRNENKKNKVKQTLDMYIRHIWGEDSHYITTLEGSKFITWPFSYYFKIENEKDLVEWEEAKNEWIYLVETMIEEINLSKGKNLEGKMKSQDRKRWIFIVHGHDDEMVQASARLVTKLGFDPIILREQPNQGRTIIEKFEDYSDVPFAIVLFSPDDEGKSVKETQLHKRPRQNVIFELGFFLGKLGRQNVVVLHKEVEDFEILSDFQGILFEPYHNGWELKIAKEIKAAGFEVDLNKLA